MTEAGISAARSEQPKCSADELTRLVRLQAELGEKANDLPPRFVYIWGSVAIADVTARPVKPD